MRNYQLRLRQLHRFVAPIMILPLLLTLFTGSLYQVAELTNNSDTFNWLLDLHKGHFGILNLDRIYPFLNALGLLTLAITGISIWFQMRRKPKKRSENI